MLDSRNHSCIKNTLDMKEEDQTLCKWKPDSLPFFYLNLYIWNCKYTSYNIKHLHIKRLCFYICYDMDLMLNLRKHENHFDECAFKAWKHDCITFLIETIAMLFDAMGIKKSERIYCKYKVCIQTLKTFWIPCKIGVSH